MPRDADSFLAADFPEVLRKIRERTPARILAGRAGAAYRTSTQLELREAHAAARDAVRAELDLEVRLRRSVHQAVESVRGLHRGAFQGRISPSAGPGTPLERNLAAGIDKALFAGE